MSMLYSSPFETAARFGWLFASMLQPDDDRWHDLSNGEILERARNAWRGWYNIVVDSYIECNGYLKSVYVTVAAQRFEIIYYGVADCLEHSIMVRECD